MYLIIFFYFINNLRTPCSSFTNPGLENHIISFSYNLYINMVQYYPIQITEINMLGQK